MQISEAAGGVPEAGAEPCRFPKLEECAHFHYERVQLPPLVVTLQTNMDRSLHSQHTNNDNDEEYYMVQVTSGEECWLLQRNIDNFKMLDAQLHQCIYDRKISQLPDLSSQSNYDNGDDVDDGDDVEMALKLYLEKLCCIVNNSLNCGPVLNWLQMDNKGHRLLVPSEESRSINTPAVAAAYSIRRYVSQARDELNLEVGDMISVIDMASPGESIWWRGKRGFQVGFFPQHCVHIIGDKVPRNMPLPPPVVGSLALSPIKPVLRKHGKLIAFFRSFILNRPSRRRLKQSGILKERVFGCDLGEHLLNSGRDVPTVLKCCAEFIEENGIVDGIYRLSGVTSNIQKLRNAFDEDRIPNLYTEEILQDIHSVASLLKMYFRELPNPLCTYQLYQNFVNAVQGCNPSSRNSDTDRERLLKMREAVQKLPPPHYRTLEYLMRHLAKVAKHGARTGMTTRNVAIVWAPNLLRSEELEGGGVAALQGVGVQAVVTEFLICYTDLIFCDHLPHLIADGGAGCVGIVVTDDQQLTIPSPKRSRPKSLAISTPTKLITLEEARTKHQIVKGEECGYIEVGGGPKNLPKKYHTVLELPSGGRKRQSSGWRSFFSKNRNSPQNNLSKLAASRKASTPGIVTTEKCGGAESVVAEMKRRLRTVKSAESLMSGISEVNPLNNNNEIIDSLGPLQSLHKPAGHNRSVSHDSYFDTIQNSHNNSEGSLLDLSEIQLNFDLEESEMRIFSEDESLVSSPRIQKDGYHRRYLARTRLDDYTSFADSSSPKKQARAVTAAVTTTVGALLPSPPESTSSMSRKRTRLEDQLSDIQYIDCSTPDNPMLLVSSASNSGSSSGTTTNSGVVTVTTVSTTAQIHHHVPSDSYQPKSKSPRNSHDSMSSSSSPIAADNGSSNMASNKRQSLNLDASSGKRREKSEIPKSLTDVNIGRKHMCLVSAGGGGGGTPITPQSPTYGPLNESSTATTPSPSCASDLYYRTLQPSRGGGGGASSTTRIFGNGMEENSDDDVEEVRRRTTDSIYENLMFSPAKQPSSTSLPSTKQSPTYENVLTTISITYKSPTKRFSNSSSLSMTANAATTTTMTTDSMHEDVTDSIERAAAVPTEPLAVLPTQEANQPPTVDSSDRSSRPKSLSALEELRSSTTMTTNRLRSISNNLSTSAVCNSRSEARTISSTIAKGSAETTTTFDSSVSSSELIDAATTPLSASLSETDDIDDRKGTTAYHHFGGGENQEEDDDDLSLSEILVDQSCSSGCGIGDGRIDDDDDYSCPVTPTQNSLSPNVSSTQPHSSTTPPPPGRTRNASSVSSLTMDYPKVGVGGDRTSTASTSSSASSMGNLRQDDRGKDGTTDGKMDKRRKPKETANGDDKNGNDDGENSIYQQVKYLRRSVHEINTLLQMESTPSSKQQPEDFFLPDFDSLDGDPHVYENINCRRRPNNEQQQQVEISNKITTVMRAEEMGTQQQHRSVVAIGDDDNSSGNACENVDVKSLTNIFEHIDDNSRSSTHHARQSRPLSSTTTISSSSPSSPTIPITTTKESNMVGGSTSSKVIGVEKNDGKKNKKIYCEKDLQLPPCVRLRNLKQHAVKTRSLDECEFSRRCGSGGGSGNREANDKTSSIEWTRRKSLDENLSALGNAPSVGGGCRCTISKSLNPPKQLPSVVDEAATAGDSILFLGHLHSKHQTAAETNAVGGVAKIVDLLIPDDTKLNRERIERYKEERRKELHEKYRSESFKEDKGALMSRLKLKPRDEIEIVPTTKKLQPSSDFGSITRRTRRRSGDSDESNELSCDSLETADTSTSTTTVATSMTKPRDKRSRQRWQQKQPQERITSIGCIADDDDQKMLTETNNISNNERKKKDSDTNRIVTVGDDRNKQHHHQQQHQYHNPEPTKSPRKGTKTSSSPSLCIKDMKAIFEPKSK